MTFILIALVFLAHLLASVSLILSALSEAAFPTISETPAIIVFYASFILSSAAKLAYVVLKFSGLWSHRHWAFLMINVVLGGFQLGDRTAALPDSEKYQPFTTFLAFAVLFECCSTLVALAWKDKKACCHRRRVAPTEETPPVDAW